MELTQIDGMRDRLIKKLSKGCRRRVGIAQALLGNPDIIILDEPTVGLDPKQITEIRGLIRKLAETKTVIISSPILAEISELCDHVLIIANGKLVANAPIKELQAGATLENIFLSLTEDPASKAPVKKKRKLIPDAAERDGEYELIDTEKEEKN